MCDRNNREADGEYLHKLILKSKEELQKRELYTTVGDREALQDMIRLAEEALAGKQQPFVRNREFLNPDDVKLYPLSR
ncbi:MAG TPA: hypothetical protein DCZ91_12975, partial [Lachnospiraceae bacterium]|nr:hypothetical protein [Lachnospiraceae bacterium]